MARPKKQTVAYFPHDADASESRTLIIIQSKFGNNGYAFWFKLLELLCKIDGHCLDLSNDMQIEFLAAKTGFPAPEIPEMMGLLCRLDAINPELWQNDKKIWCQKLLNRVKDAYRKRIVDFPEKPVSGAGNQVSSAGNGVSSAGIVPEIHKEKEKEEHVSNIHALNALKRKEKEKNTHEKEKDVSTPLPPQGGVCAKNNSGENINSDDILVDEFCTDVIRKLKGGYREIKNEVGFRIKTKKLVLENNAEIMLELKKFVAKKEKQEQQNKALQDKKIIMDNQEEQQKEFEEFRKNYAPKIAIILLKHTRDYYPENLENMIKTAEIDVNREIEIVADMSTKTEHAKKLSVDKQRKRIKLRRYKALKNGLIEEIVKINEQQTVNPKFFCLDDYKKAKELFLSKKIQVTS